MMSRHTPVLLSCATALALLACGTNGVNDLDLDQDRPSDGLSDPGFGTPDDPCDGLDNNVDGTVDEGCYCEGLEVQTCYPGDPSQVGVGACRTGLQACVDPRGDFWQGRWSVCVGAVLPSPEICGNTVDEDCDGFVAPCQDGDLTGLPCHPGESAKCYTGPPGTEGFGLCAAGARACGEQDLWGPCEGDRLPEEEICGNGLDEDCDGLDDGC